MKEIKILYCIPCLAKAGTEKHLLDLASGLENKGFKTNICCLFKTKEENEKYNLPKLKLICLERKNTYDLHIIFDLFRLIKKERYDIIHTYLFGFHFLTTIPAKLLNVPLVISSRRELATWKKYHHRLLENLGNLFTDKVIACSEAVRKFSLQTENLSPEKITTIYNGIDLEKFLPQLKNTKILNELNLKETDKIIGMVANFSSVKSHETLLGAVAEIKKTYPQIKCLFVGDGYLRKNIEKKIQDLNLGENIRLTGRRDDIEDILSIMDIFILTSLSEGLPNVVLEAMACGLPVVATRVEGICETVEDNRTGILAESRDFKGIANAIIKLLDNKDLRKEMGKCGREKAEKKFKLERMVKDYESFYEKLFSVVICPICGSKKNKAIFQKENYNYLKCYCCGLVFIWPQPQLEAISQLYQQWGENYYLDKNKIEFDYGLSFEERLSQIEPYRDNNRLLDVGCSIGAFLCKARERKWDTYGVEISKPSVLYAKNVKKLNVFAGTLKEAHYEDEYFDVVNIWAVLEHVPNPLDILIESYRILRKGGLLVFCVPNFNCLPIKVLGKRYRYISAGHLFYFSQETIMKLLDRCGFKTVKISSEYFSPLALIQDMRRIPPETLKTNIDERQILKIVKQKRSYIFILRPFWKIFMFVLRKLYLAEELRVLAIK